MSALDALDRAHAAGVTVTLDGDGLILATKASPLPAEIVALLKSVKPDLLVMMAAREAGTAALAARPPPDCLEGRWREATRGLERFVTRGWGDKAALLGWTPEELYRVPPLWSRIDLTGAALLVGYRRVTAVTADNIVIESRSGSQLRFRRIGREHLA
jgi:hypothetical protein